MRQTNWHRVFSTEDKLIQRIDARENPSAEDALNAAEDVRQFYRNVISGGTTLGELLRSKQRTTPSAQ